MRHDVLFNRALNGTSNLIGIISVCPGCRFVKGIVGSEECIRKQASDPIKFNPNYVYLEDGDLAKIPQELCLHCSTKETQQTASPQ